MAYHDDTYFYDMYGNQVGYVAGQNRAELKRHGIPHIDERFQKAAAPQPSSSIGHYCHTFLYDANGHHVGYVEGFSSTELESSGLSHISTRFRNASNAAKAPATDGKPVKKLTTMTPQGQSVRV